MKLDQFAYTLSELIKKHNSSNRTRPANDHCLLSILPISKMCLWDKG